LNDNEKIDPHQLKEQAQESMSLWGNSFHKRLGSSWMGMYLPYENESCRPSD